MNIAARQTYLIAEQFDEALNLLRQELADHDLCVTDEFDATEYLSRDSGRKPDRSRLLLVDCPLPLLEAVALDRAAGVLIPLHILASSDGDRTEVVFIEASTLFDRRAPVGVSQPLGELKSRIAMALEAAVARAEAQRGCLGDVS
jgi:uncharacterized protein (DUF302 family)